jgi:putative ATP-binding cassette transporter
VDPAVLFATSRRAWAYFLHVAKPYFTSENRRTALGLLVTLIILLLAITGLNVVNSYVGRDFMTAIADRETGQVYWLALVYLGVFAASTSVGGFARLTEMVLGLRWREWLTRRFLDRYLSRHAYYYLNVSSEVDNPDERIADDIKTFTTSSLSFLILAFNSIITIAAFSGVLWSITPWLFLASAVYPVLGTSLTVLVGRRLVRLNNLQLKKEGDFRFGLVHVREQAEAIALVHAEHKEGGRTGDRLTRLVRNFRTIIDVIFYLRLLTGGYNYLTQLIPVLIVAPLYFSGDVEFGVVTQAAMAFSQVFNAFSLIIEQYQDLSQFVAVVNRLGRLDDAIVHAGEPLNRQIHIVEEDAHFAYHNVTLWTPKQHRVLLHEVTLEIPPQSHVLVTGPNEVGKCALFRATAGLWDSGRGEIVRPEEGEILFLPQSPYLVLGTLRDQFYVAPGQRAPSDGEILTSLRQVGMEALVNRVGGLDTRHAWATVLSVEERQLLAVARLLLRRPAFAFLEHALAALNEQRKRTLFRLLAEASIAYITIDNTPAAIRDFHEAQLELNEDGSWKMQAIPRGSGMRAG